MHSIRAYVLLLAAIFLCCLNVYAQPAGNEWIDYDRQYWKFPVTQDGIYHITYQDLANGGFPVASVNPQQIRIFGKGKECRLYIDGETDGVFDPSDHIELFAAKNDAWLDSLVYEQPVNIPNPAYSLFNDTAYYFLTIGSAPGLRTVLSGLQNFGDYTPVEFCWVRSYKEFHAVYLQGKQDINGIGLPTYDMAEGWFDMYFPKGTSYVQQIPTSGAYTLSNAPPAKAKCISASASLAMGFPDHHLQVAWGDAVNVVVDTSFYGYQLNQFDFEIPATSLGSNSTAIIHRSIDDLGVASDYNAVSYLEIEYAHTFDFQDVSEFEFSLQNPGLSPFLLIAFEGFTGINPVVYVRNQTVQYRVHVFQDNGLWKAIIPTDGLSNIDALLKDESDVHSVSGIVPVTQSGYFTDYISDEIDHAFVIITHPELWSAAQNYAAWRNNGETHSVVADVEELYMQYAYGIQKHPLAIRRFCNDMIMSWSAPPEHLFLIGKSVHEANNGNITGARNNPVKYAMNLVPTWGGYPGSDAVFTAGLNGTLYEPAIPTGRLSAQNAEEVLEYLNKVIEHESQPPKMWQKNILHFGGGTIDYEQQLFRGYLNTYKHMASDTCMGANVYSFFKNTSDPIQMNVSDSIHLLINEGVSLMTFFGHASSNGFDQNIDTPESYTNQGKYPLLIGNSCYTGNIHLSDSESASENFVLVPNRGVIGFLAKIDVGIPVYLNMYTENFYRQMFNENYGHTVGYGMKKAIENFQVPGDFYRANTALYFTLHGDPAIKLHPHEKPDYCISSQSVFFEPADVVASQSSLVVKVVVENPGKSTNENVGIELVRHYPNGADSSYIITVDRILTRDTITFEIPNNTDIAAGENTFDVFVDYPLNAIAELDDAGNNIVQSLPLFISSGDLFPSVPYPFEVVSNPQPVLKASTGFPLEPTRTYVIQVDSTDHFNSPLFHSITITQSGGVVEWPMPFAAADSMVVFWRCSADSISPAQTFQWHTSSFQFVANQEGWGQQHFFQFRDNAAVNLFYNENERLWEFDPTHAHLKCQVYGASTSPYEALSTRYQLNLNVLEYGGYGYEYPALMVAVLDSSTFMPWESNYNGLHPEHDYGNTLGSANARHRPERYFIFQQQDPAQLSGFVNMIDDIPEGNYVLVYTWQLAQKDNWMPDVINTFSDLGADDVIAAPDSVPFIFFMKKGHPETILEVVGSFPQQYLVLESDLTGSIGAGTIYSPIIGPAKDWGNTEWKLNSNEAMEGDSTTIRLHGLNWQGEDYVLAEWQQIPSEADLDPFVNVEQFPFLKLEARLRDYENYTAPQIHSWHVWYEKVPECALDPASGLYINSDTLQQGEKFLVAVAIHNISALDMDSLKVSYRVEDESRNFHDIYYPVQAPLLSGSIFYDTLEIDTRNFSGNNVLHIDANPINLVTGIPHQAEQAHFNNVARISFVVEQDNINPLLDVTFDGRHILNGDLVSAQPDITITLDDENPYFILNEPEDTSHFKIFLSKPGVSFEPVYFSSNAVEWIPAESQANKSRIEYRPRFDEDGEYVLRVQAADKSGNISGDCDYQVHFEIISKPSITEVLNYPNPFSTRTQFVFTLTGSEPPDQMKIQIMTIGGDIVREITQDELGPLRIGRNLTEYWWDGTDEYGDRLANGVYLYRVMARLHGENVELSETAASRYFTKGFGKMYLFR